MPYSPHPCGNRRCRCPMEYTSSAVVVRMAGKKRRIWLCCYCAEIVEGMEPEQVDRLAVISDGEMVQLDFRTGT